MTVRCSRLLAATVVPRVRARALSAGVIEFSSRTIDSPRGAAAALPASDAQSTMTVAAHSATAARAGTIIERIERSV